MFADILTRWPLAVVQVVLFVFNISWYEKEPETANVKFVLTTPPEGLDHSRSMRRLSPPKLTSKTNNVIP